MFHCLGPHVTEKSHFLIKDFYIVSIPQFEQDGILYPVFISSNFSLVVYHISIGTHIGHKNYIYTNLCNSAEKPK